MKTIKDDSFYRSMHDYLKIYMPKQRKLSNNTIKSYKGTLNQYLDFLTDVKKIPEVEITLEDLNRENVTAYLDWLQESRKCSSTTRNQRLMALRSFAKYCSITDVANIYLRLEVNKVPIQNVPGKIVDFLSDDAMQALLSIPDMKSHFGLRNGFFMLLMYDTAARCQEMLNIRLEDFVIGDKSSYVYLHGKGDKFRPVALMDKTVAHYKRYMHFYHPEETQHPQDNLFYTVIKGNRDAMSPDTVAYFLDQYAKKANKICSSCPTHVHPHQFRHTRAIQLYRSGVPLSVLQELLGHENPSTTRIYAFASPEMKAENIAKATNDKITPDVESKLWRNDREMIRQLYCLD